MVIDCGFVRPMAGGGSKLTVVNQTDVKGSIPKHIINVAAGGALVRWFKTFKVQFNSMTIIERDCISLILSPALPVTGQDALG